MPLLRIGAVDTAYLQRPVVVRLVISRVGLEVLVNLGEESLGGHDDDGLGPADLVILVGDVFLACAGDVVEGVEEGDEVGESFSCAVVGVDDDAEILEVVLQGDGQRFCLNQRGLLVVVVLQQ